jgi:hypothetical protein
MMQIIAAAAARRNGGGGVYDPATDASVVQWWKADALALSNGDAVSTWTASKGVDAAPALVGYAPQFVTAQQNGLPAIRCFESGSHRFLRTVSPFGPIPQPYTVWAVFQQTNISQRYLFLFDGYASGEARAWFSDYDLPNRWCMAAGPTQILRASKAPDTAWHILRCVFSGAGSSIALDGGTPVVGDAGTRLLSGLTIGAIATEDKAAAFLVGEMLVQNSATNESAIWAYLNDRWAIY